jgi:BirA family biotin operon repressor/biotin-[acetyl-CoA-carboxylase] ligase
MDDQLDPEKIKERCKRHLQARDIVREVLLFDSVGSTNRTALEMASLGVPGGVVILAETQGKGKGRLGRSWFSPRGVNIYLSLLLRPHQPAREFPLFSLATAVALVEAIGATTGLKVEIKWPNDILLNDKKVAGILLETETDGGQAPSLVVGIGVNVNLNEADFPPDLQATATSLKTALGQPVDRTELTISLLGALAQQYLLLEEGKREAVIESVKGHCQTLGKKVRVDTPHRTFEGWAETIEEEGALRVRLGDGSRRKILVGDITHLREVKE